MSSVQNAPDIGEAMSLVCKTLRVRPAQLARMLGLDQSTCQKWVYNQRPVSFRAMKRFRERLGLDLYMFAWCMSHPMDGSRQSELAHEAYEEILDRLEGIAATLNPSNDEDF